MTDTSRIEELRQRLSRDPASIAFAQLAEEYRRNGDYEKAIGVCREGLARHPAYVSARVTLGRSLLELEQYDEAQVELDAVIRVAPDNLAAIRALAEIHQRRPEFVDMPTVEAPGAVDPMPVAAKPTVADEVVGAVAPGELAGTPDHAPTPAPSGSVLGELEGWLAALQRDRARSDT